MVSEPPGISVPSMSWQWKAIANVVAIGGSLGLVVAYSVWLDAVYVLRHFEARRFIFIALSCPLYAIACFAFVLYVVSNDVLPIGWPHLRRCTIAIVAMNFVFFGVACVDSSWRTKEMGNSLYVYHHQWTSL